MKTKFITNTVNFGIIKPIPRISLIFRTIPLHPTFVQVHPTPNFQTIGPPPLAIHHPPIPSFHLHQHQPPSALRPQPRVTMGLKIPTVTTTTPIPKIRTNKLKITQQHRMTWSGTTCMKIMISTLRKRMIAVKMTGITSNETIPLRNSYVLPQTPLSVPRTFHLLLRNFCLHRLQNFNILL